jgi:molybdenum cofactor guanylyltransferase
MPSPDRVTTVLTDMEGFILAGGRSSRFGSDKALALWKGRPLLAHAVAAFKGLGLTPRVVCRDSSPYVPWAHAFVMRERPSLGPLEGLRAALTSASHSWALVLTADMPLLRGNHLRRLLAAAGPETAVVFGTSDGIRHPFPGLYPRSALAAIDALPDASSVQALLDRVPVRLLDADPDLVRALQNVNTPEDLAGLN